MTRQIENFIKNHCSGDIEKFIEVISLVNKGCDLEQMGQLYNISPSNLSRRLSMFTRVTFKEDVWQYLKMLNKVNQSNGDRAERIISDGSKILKFTASETF